MASKKRRASARTRARVRRPMTPRQAAALKKAQAASAAKRRGKRRRAFAVVAGTAFVAGAVASHQATNQKNRLRANGTQERIVRRHVARARAHNRRFNALTARVFPATMPRAFDPDAARREAQSILRKRKR